MNVVRDPDIEDLDPKISEQARYDGDVGSQGCGPFPIEADGDSRYESGSESAPTESSEQSHEASILIVGVHGEE